MSRTAQTVAETRNLGERISVDGKDELSGLASTFNAMLDSLDTAMRSQRRLVSDASHELRTPLTSLRTNIEVLRDYSSLGAEDRERLLRDLARESEELSALVESLVDLARGSQRDLHLRELELETVVEDVVERAATRFPELRFEHRSEPTTVVGDAQQLDRALWNLVENAAKWSEPGGVVEVATARGEVTVRDHGPGIDPATCRSCSTASTARRRLAAGRARVSAWRSSGRWPRATAARWRSRRRRAAGRASGCRCSRSAPRQMGSGPDAMWRG